MMHFHTATFYGDGSVRCRSTVKPHVVMLAAGQAHIESAGDLLGLSTQQLISLFNHLSDDERIKRVAPDTVERVWAMLSAPRHEASTYAPDAAAAIMTSAPEPDPPQHSPAPAEAAPASRSKPPRRDGGASRPTAPSDAFGLAPGSRAAAQAALLAQPQGATMAEVKAATGDSCYNLLKRLESSGHTIRKDGKRIFLIAKET